jgi:hypothetical protein
MHAQPALVRQQRSRPEGNRQLQRAQLHWGLANASVVVVNAFLPTCLLSAGASCLLDAGADTKGLASHNLVDSA